MRDYSVHLHRKPSRRTNLLPIIIGVVLFLILTSAVLYFYQRKDIQKTPLLPLQPNVSSQKELLEQIDKISQTTGGTFSVYIYDINKKQGFGVNE
ncbi:hypothetical protein HZB96_05100 [Candidatus Gottesmanbacteria bacterium]|nr:hypothetical protein [Candidatus Gottesmanbacteria bacterium]